MKRRLVLASTFTGALLIMSCDFQSLLGPALKDSLPNKTEAPTSREVEEKGHDPIPVGTTSTSSPLSRLPASAFQYQGAFRLPKESTSGTRWGYGGYALAHRVSGDPSGASDGYPGSLFGSGHTQHNLVSEVSIPQPSMSREVVSLPEARTLQPFGDITGGIQAQLKSTYQFDRLGGLTLLPADATGGKEVLCWNVFRFYMVQSPSESDWPTHGCSDTRLGAAIASGPFRVGSYGDADTHYKKTANYMFSFPKDWADAHLGGHTLATGRGDGAGNSSTSHGPALFVMKAEDAANAPANGSVPAKPLLYYPSDGSHFPNWSPCDSWEGAAFVRDGNRAAVMFIGRKGIGTPRYGPGEEDNCDKSKGYHCDPYEVQFLLYDAAELAEVYRGKRTAWSVKPYAVHRPGANFLPNCMGSTGAAAYDPSGKLLYVIQPKGETPVVHVWKVGG